MANDCPDDDEVLAGLAAVVESLRECRGYIDSALARAERVAAARSAGTPLAEIFHQQPGPSVLELMTAVLTALSDSGSTLRRAEARGLYAEGLSMEKIARLFGVSRQRVSSLLQAPALDRRESRQSDRRRGGLAFTDPELRMIADALPHIVWVAAPDGTTEYVNAQGVDYMDGPRGAHEWNSADVIHPEDAARAHEGWASSIRSGTPFEADYRIRRADGVWRWHTCRALPIRGPEGQVVKWVGTATDVEDCMRRGTGGSAGE